MPNRLAASTSPYLRQHQDNPVDWYEWGEEAFAAARVRDVPILLSVGYSACHWCHVMAHESFEDDATAAQMNEQYVNVKVDREERPDVDSVYMEAVQAMSGRGGWPMTVWLHPDGRPFYAGTYFPKDTRGGMPSFRSVLDAIAEAWNQRREDLGEQANRLTEAISRTIPSGDVPGREVLEQAYRQLEATFDETSAGFGGAPKFPQQPTLEFLLRIVDREWAPEAGRMLSSTLASMARGGIYDQVGGGFARYAVDSIWLVPHFEKMLYDNAQLARLYLWASVELDAAPFRTIAEETLEYLRRDLRHPDGGFFSAEDADSEGEEGKFYVFTAEEFDAIVGEDAPMARRFFGVTDAGNFEGSNVLHVARSISAIAADADLDPDDVEAVVMRSRHALLQARSKRIRPGLDHKVVAAWNGIAIRAFAEAGSVLGRPDLVEDAEACARFVLERMLGADGRVVRSWSEGQTSADGFLDDQASVALGLFALYQATGEIEWYRHAERLTRLVPALYADPAGGFFTTAADAEALVKRPKDQFDNPLPSGNSMAAEALLWLSLYTGEPDLADLVEATLGAGALLLERYPSGAGHLAAVVAAIDRGTAEVAVVGDDPEAFRDAFYSAYRPGTVLATSPATGDDIPLMQNRPSTDITRAFVCHGFLCDLPVEDPDQMIARL